MRILRKQWDQETITVFLCEKGQRISPFVARGEANVVGEVIRSVL
jgi:hypothetical protein